MYRFYFNRVKNTSPYAELIRVFLNDGTFEVIAIDMDIVDHIKFTDKSYWFNSSDYDDTDHLKRELYRLLQSMTGKSPKWGTLTGVRPLKPFLQTYLDTGNDMESTVRSMKEKYLISESKAEILSSILEYQINNVRLPAYDKTSIYIGIPFCPTRCSYCAFAADVAPGHNVISDYLDLLIREIKYTAENTGNLSIESVYFGGGTPTTLNADELGILIDTVCGAFGIDPSATEITVEAGRPDTIDDDKLWALSGRGIGRISINPQSLKDETLIAIGREHRSEDILDAVRLARSHGIRTINSDVIAGLPGESLQDFQNTLDTLVSLDIENITVHTLSVKRGSRLRETDPEYYTRYGELVNGMLEYARTKLSSSGYHPYYIYRQKHQIGALENIGWCKYGTHSVYNIRTMEDKQTIIGLGAGAIGKIYYPDEDRIERVANISNYEIYMSRFDEILERKKEYFGGTNGNQCT